MPYSRPGVIQLIDSASKALWHGQPAQDDGYVGVAVKIVAPSAGAGSGTPQKQIAVGEKYNLIKKGEVQVDAVSGAAIGDGIYITSGNVLTKTAGSNTKFGKVSAVAGFKGCPTGKMRVDLDAKDSF